MLGHLNVIDQALGAKVADAMGLAGEADTVTPGIAPVDLAVSPALRIVAKYPPTLKGRKIGVLIAPGFDAALMTTMVEAIQAEGATVAIIGAKVGGVEDASGTKHAADRALSGSPSVLFDAVAVLAGPNGDKALAMDHDAVSFLMDACRHLKAISISGAPTLTAKAQVEGEIGVTEVSGKDHVSTFLEFARNARVWDRDPA